MLTLSGAAIREWCFVLADVETPMNAPSRTVSSAFQGRQSSQAAFLCLALGISSVGVATFALGAGGTVPTDFTDSLVLSGFNSPVGMTSLPDGRVLVVEQFTGRIRLIVN